MLTLIDLDKTKKMVTIFKQANVKKHYMHTDRVSSNEVNSMTILFGP